MTSDVREMATPNVIPIDSTSRVGVRAARKAAVMTAAAAVWLVLIDAIVASIALPVSYWLRLDAPVLVWPESASLPSDVVNNFRPYLSVLLITPLVRFFCLKH